MNTRADITVADSVPYVALNADITVENQVAHVALKTGASARLDRSVLVRINAALDAVEDASGVDMVVLSSQHGFPTGLTVPRGGGDDHDNLLAKTCNRIEAFPKPVIAVVTGSVVAGGAELALACHYRLAHRAARTGFPYAQLGLVPNAGATQRLPRLIGAKPALDLLLSGRLVNVSDASLRGLADAVFDDNTYQAVVDFTASLKSEGCAPRPTAQVRRGFVNAKAYQTAVQEARKTATASHDSAAAHIIAAVEAALVLPMEAGLAFEQAAYDDCSDTPKSRALSHVFMAEQVAAEHTKRPDLPPMSSVAVLGGGPYASQIVLSAFDGGLRVNWVIKDEAQRRNSLGHVQSILQNAVRNGRISATSADRFRDALSCSGEAAIVEGSDFVLRAARGQRGVSLPVDVPLAHCLPGTDPRLALQFAFISGQTRLVEIVLGPDGQHTDLRAALRLAKQLKLIAIPQKAGGPCLSERLRHAQWRAADALVDRGQSPYTIDAAMAAWGIETPPFAAADQAGLTTVARHDRHADCMNWARVLSDAGRSGMGETGGFYAYDAARTASKDEAVTDLINKTRAPAPDMPSAHIQRLIVGAMANEAARALREKQIDRASDVEVVSVHTGLTPRWRGGLLHAATAEGLLKISHAMASMKHLDAEFWTPEPVFTDLIKNGRGFDDI